MEEIKIENLNNNNQNYLDQIKQSFDQIIYKLGVKMKKEETQSFNSKFKEYLFKFLIISI